MRGGWRCLRCRMDRSACGRRRRWRFRSAGLYWRWRHKVSGSLVLDDLDLRSGMTEFRELRRNQRMIFRVVHHADVVGEFRIEADGENIFRKRNRMRFEEIAAGKWTRASDGIEQSWPER